MCIRDSNKAYRTSSPGYVAKHSEIAFHMKPGDDGVDAPNHLKSIVVKQDDITLTFVDGRTSVVSLTDGVVIVSPWMWNRSLLRALQGHYAPHQTYPYSLALVAFGAFPDATTYTEETLKLVAEQPILAVKSASGNLSLIHI